MHPADAQASWIFSNVWGDCPAAYEFVADGGASAIASDYCSGFTDFHVGISGRVVRFDAIGAVDAYVPTRVRTVDTPVNRVTGWISGSES